MKNLSLYEILFGNKDIPMQNELSFDQDSKIVLFGTALILVLGALATASIINSKPQKR